MRYRSVFDVDGVHTFDQAQQRILFQGKLKLDREAKYTIGFRLSSGRYFDWAFANFAGGGATQANLKSTPRLGTEDDRADAVQAGLSAATFPSAGWAVVPRELYFSAKPLEGFEFQYGSLGINRGINSEITSYDDDGYLAGGRVIIRKPHYLYFDEVSVTYGDLGYLYSPNFFSRYQALAHFKYHQFLVRKKIVPWLEASTDYTYQLAHTLREAAIVKTNKVHFVDSVRIEAYQRLNAVNADNEQTDSYLSGNGFAVTAEKTFFKRVSIQAGFAKIDTDYDVYSASGDSAIWGHALNGDNYGLGKRPFVRANIKVLPYLSLFGFYTHLVGFNYDRDGFIWNNAVLHAGMQLDFKNLLHLDK